MNCYPPALESYRYKLIPNGSMVLCAIKQSDRVQKIRKFYIQEMWHAPFPAIK
jgi:hypothetical protein